MNNQTCNVCSSQLEEQIYEASAKKSLTSLSIGTEKPTNVYFCHECQHVQTIEYGDESSYYDVSYNILTSSEEEDQIYLVENGQTIYRTDHQVSTLVNHVEIFDGMKIVDYGCAKSSTMVKLLKSHKKADVHLYDVSANYEPFWSKFLDSSKWATYTIPEDWLGEFDLVTSFFSLEHITDLADVINKVKSLLKPGGAFYAVVPNFLTNIADMIVVDHPNHFTESSIHHLLSESGFSVQNIDKEAHRGALVITAKLDQQASKKTKQLGVYEKAIEISAFWSKSSEKIAKFEELHQTQKSAIYGAGFYGAFLAANINNLTPVQCIIDQNPHLQGKLLFDREVTSLDQIPDDIEVVYVGLNPTYAKSIIESTPFLAERNFEYFYL